MRIVKEFSFKNGIDELNENKPGVLESIRTIIQNIDATDCKTKESQEDRRTGLLYSPILMNRKFKNAFESEGWAPKRIPCPYKQLESLTEAANTAVTEIRSELADDYYRKADIVHIIREKITALQGEPIQLCKPEKVYEKLRKGRSLEVGTERETRRKYRLLSSVTEVDLASIVTPDFVGFREMDAVRDKVGVEVQFGKYAFMVYNVCAKMTIFHKKCEIDYGVEIVPVKSLQSEMSTGVAFYEQFIWDLENRGSSDIDIPVVVIGIGI